MSPDTPESFDRPADAPRRRRAIAAPVARVHPSPGAAALAMTFVHRTPGLYEIDGDGRRAAPPADHCVRRVSAAPWPEVALGHLAGPVAVGIVVVGTGTPERGPALIGGAGPALVAAPPGGDRDGERPVRTALYMACDGGFGAAALLDEGLVRAVEVPESCFDVDLLARTLGVATTPATSTPSELAAAMWLHDLVRCVSDPCRAAGIRTWRDALTHHPFVACLEPRDAQEVLDGATPASLARLAHGFDAAISWERLLAIATRSPTPPFDLTHELCRWIDAPFFARWMLGSRRGVAEQLADLALFAEGELWASVSSAVASMESLWSRHAGRADRRAEWAHRQGDQ
ncbi:MAG: hypothetical protein R2698_10075 [Microthrixaceae bacterium]